jgi:hypothetical protein
VLAPPLPLTRFWRSPAVWGAITKVGAVQARSRPHARPTGPHEAIDRGRVSHLGPRSRTLRASFGKRPSGRQGPGVAKIEGTGDVAAR